MDEMFRVPGYVFYEIRNHPIFQSHVYGITRVSSKCRLHYTNFSSLAQVAWLTVLEMNTKESKTLFVRNIGYSVTKDELEDSFSEYGPIKQCFIVTDGGKSTCNMFSWFGS